MSSPYVCLRCRHALLTRGHQVRGAGFVSLGKLVDSDWSEQSLPTQRGTDGEKIHEPQRTRHSARRNRKQHDPQLESLFSTNVRRKDITFDQQSTRANKGAQPVYVVPARTLVDEYIQTLDHLLYKQRAPLVEIWKACQELLGSKTWQQMVSDAANEEDVVFSTVQLNIFRDILLQVAYTRSRHPSRVKIPLVANAIRSYKKHNLMENWWDQVLWKQLSGYMWLSPYYSWRPDRPADAVRQDPSIVLEEIIEVWRLLVHEYGEPARSSSAEFMSTYSSDTSPTPSFGSSSLGGKSRWSHMPSRLLNAERQTLPSDISQRFSEYWPRHLGATHQTTRMITAAIMTFDCLKRAHKEGFSKEHIMADSKSLVQFLTPLVQGGQINWDSAMTCLGKEGIARLTAHRIIQGWGALPIAVTGAPPSEEVSSKPPVATQSIEPVSGIVSKLTSALRNATQKADTALVTSLWQEFQRKIGLQTIEEPHRDELFSQFLSAFFTVRRQTEAVEVWNFMVNTDHQPTLKHWHAMLVGCTAAKDLTSIRKIWNNMLGAGIEPDLKTWTIWIHGLAACGDWQSGLRALEDLGKIWKPAPTVASEASQELLTPSLVPVRAALSGLAKSNNIDLADAVLAWAEKQNLPLDTQTYNIILRPPVRVNNEPKVKSILQSMQANNCEPDIATFTIMLNGLLSNPSSTFHTQTPEEQQKAVFAILHDLEGHGLKANTYTYSTILDGLLDAKVLNIAAARAVMEHMTQNNIKASPHVYTILTTHYFSLSPPDLAAIDSLLHRTRLEKTPLDPIFYDRMIENYARVGETEKMLLMLRRMPQEGKSPGWMALLACLRALVEAREWENVWDLVRDVEDVGGLLRHGSGPWRGKDAFWELVAEVRREGLLGEE